MTKLNSRSKISTLILTIFILAAGLSGCSDTPVTSTQANNLSFSVMSSNDSIGDLQNVLVLDTVKILISDVKLNVSNSNQDSANFKTGPFVLFLNLTTSINEISSAIIPAGTYNGVKFEIHKLNVNEAVPDPEFADGNGRYSVVIKGTYLGNYFIYKSTKSAHQILHFPDMLTLASDRLYNITMVVKPYIWFINNGSYMDPMNPANSNDIDNNIKDNINNNLRSFKDNDRNGLPD